MLSKRTLRTQSKVAIFIPIILVTFLGFTYLLFRCDIHHDKISNTFTLCSFNSGHIRAIFLMNRSENHQQYSLQKSAKSVRLKTEPDKPVVHCRESVKHLVFLKVHKTGSSTILNIVYRYGLQNQLTFALPKNANYFNHVSNEFNSSQIVPVPNGYQFEILCNHAIYNRSAMRTLFPNDTFYFSILRQPFKQFVSASRYYGLIQNKQLQVEKPYQTFFLNRKNFTFLPGYDFFDNRMSFDLGLESKYFHDADKIREFIKTLDNDFNLMLISDYFDESLVLLRRYLCWTMKDIVSFHMNVNSRRNNYTFSVDDFSLHRKQTTADYTLYQHYLKIFWQRISSEGPSFYSELAIFQNIQELIVDFCLHFRSTDALKIPASQWNDAFRITQTDCFFMLKTELKFLHYIREKQKQRFQNIQTPTKDKMNTTHKKHEANPKSFHVQERK